MKNNILKYFILLLSVLVVLIVYFSTVGIETNKFNNQIKKRILLINKKIDIDLKKIKLTLDPFKLKIYAKTIGTTVYFAKRPLALESIKTQVSLSSLIKNKISSSNIEVTTRSILLNDLIKFIRTTNYKPELFILEKIIINLKDHYKDIPNKLLVYQVLRNSISNMINDIYETTKKNLIENNINSINDIRKKNNFVISFSNEMKKNCDIIKKFLFDKVYNHSHLSDKRQYSKKVISTLFTYFVKNNNKLPIDWRNQNIEIERLICDYISGMTDRFALNLYKENSE